MFPKSWCIPKVDGARTQEHCEDLSFHCNVDSLIANEPVNKECEVVEIYNNY